MTRQPGQAFENGFIRGLITEATGLNFPEQACYDTDNCVFDRKGEIRRRLGIEYEVGYALNSAVGTDGVVKEYLWKSVGSNGLTNFVVVQQGTGISFYEPDAGGNISDNIKPFSINLQNYATAGTIASELQQSACEFASGKGRLFINHPFCEPLFVEYDPESDNITITEYEIEIRDFEGVDDGLAIDFRPSTLTTLHKYNIYNQGWYASGTVNRGNTTPDGIGSGNYAEKLFQQNGYYPSNCDIWWVNKDFEGVFNVTTVLKNEPGNSPAPKGHYIDNAFFFDRSNVSGIPGLATISSDGARPGAVAFFAGRIWYGGVNHSDYIGRVYYTQIIESNLQIGKCYQRNDPTAENLSDLLASDGGVIDILEAGTIYKLVPIASAILVFASNGVWMITGSQGIGFSSTDFSVLKLTSIPAVSAYNFVIVDGYPFWWNYAGIYTIIPEGGQQTFKVQSLTDETIKSFYQDIPAESMRFAKGAFNTSSRVLQWIYRTEDVVDFIDNFTYHKMLNFDLTTKTFYPWSITESSNNLLLPEIRGIVCLDSAGISHVEETVVDNAGATVVDAAGNTVTASTIVEGGALSAKLKYIVTGLLEEPGQGSTDPGKYLEVSMTQGSSSSGGFNGHFVVDQTNERAITISVLGFIHCWNIRTGALVWSRDSTLDVANLAGQSQPILDHFGNVHFCQENTTAQNLYSYNVLTGAFNGASGMSANPGLAGVRMDGQGVKVGNKTYIYLRALSSMRMYETTDGITFTLKATNTSHNIGFALDLPCHAFKPATYVYSCSVAGALARITWGSTASATTLNLATYLGITAVNGLCYNEEDDTLIVIAPEGGYKLNANSLTLISTNTSLASSMGNIIFGIGGISTDHIAVSVAGTLYTVFNATTFNVIQTYSASLWTNGGDLINGAAYLWNAIGLFIAADQTQTPLGRSVFFAFDPAGGFDDVTYRISFAESYDTTYHDWVIHSSTVTDPPDTDGIDYSSYFMSGAKVHAHGDKAFTYDYLTVFSRTETNSSCFMQGRWDYANNSDSGKWTNPQQVYSTKRGNRDVSRKRLIIRGFGPALYMRYYSEEGKPFNIIGWSGFVTQDAQT